MTIPRVEILLRWVEVSSVRGGRCGKVRGRGGRYGMAWHGIAWGGKGDEKKKGKDWKV